MIIKKKTLLATYVVEARRQKPHMDETSTMFINNKLQLIIDGRVHSFPLLLDDGSVIQMLYQIKVNADFCLKFTLESSDTLLIWFPERKKRNTLQQIQYLREAILNDEDNKKFILLQTRLKQLAAKRKVTGLEAPKYGY
jgi:hypothetical protein